MRMIQATKCFMMRFKFVILFVHFSCSFGQMFIILVLSFTSDTITNGTTYF